MEEDEEMMEQGMKRWERYKRGWGKAGKRTKGWRRG